MASIIKGNLRLPPRGRQAKRRLAKPTHLWLLGDIGEAIAIQVLHQWRFWRIVKPLLFQHKEEDGVVNHCHFISPGQIRQGICFMPTMQDLYYRKILSVEQNTYHFYHWDFVATKIHKENHKFVAYPCLIEVKTQRREAVRSYDYESFMKKDFSAEKERGFKIFCLRILLHDNWDYEAELNEL